MGGVGKDGEEGAGDEAMELFGFVGGDEDILSPAEDESLGRDGGRLLPVVEGGDGFRLGLEGLVAGGEGVVQGQAYRSGDVVGTGEETAAENLGEEGSPPLLPVGKLQRLAPALEQGDVPLRGRGGGADQDEAVHPFRPTEGQTLGDIPSQGVAQEVHLLQGEVVQKG